MPLEIEPLKRKETLGDLAAERLRDAIMSGRFSPGERLPIRAVANSLGVSMTPVREALFNLVATGALVTDQNGGVCVPALNAERIRELCKIRCSLEGLAAGEAASRLTDADIAEMERLNQHFLNQRMVVSFSEMRAINRDFHFIIYHSSGMPNLVGMIEACWLISGSYSHVLYPSYSGNAYENHSKIIAAAQKRNPESFAEAVCADIRMASDQLLRATV